MTKFEGFGPNVRKWFQGLEADNSREYFVASRDFFEESIRGQMEALLTELSEKFGGEVKMFRQNRDIRFSPDKSPYKTNTYGIVYGSGMAAQGLYASISAVCIGRHTSQKSSPKGVSAIERRMVLERERPIAVSTSGCASSTW